ncbi:mitochondrial ribosomal small subunit component [Stygiomarasmius scandens]|uniref:Small ribosomal subunit protein mS23 n=1 Tax=Marasmiellus scandens TaxID=2682957 RepID=A0ABR1JM42_9AGAR
MVRRIASQVHQQVSRLMRGNVIKEEPRWYKAVLEHPPLPLPSKAPPTRTAYDTKQPKSQSKPRPYDPKPLSIYYLEDDIRRQFFRDHPFEAFRPTTLTESATIAAAHPIQGKEWTRLRQRGRKPSPEDAVQFALNLHQHHGLSLSYAYARAVAQFRALRSEHHIATTMAATEADCLGGIFQNSEVAHAFEKEIKSLATWERQAELDEGAMAARKRWRSIVQGNQEPREWSKGQEYVRLWKEGIKPQYLPALTEPVNAPPTPQQLAQTPNYLGLNAPA